MEIDEQAEWDIQHFHVAEELRFADRMQNFDSLQLNQQTVVHENVEPQQFVEDKAFIFNSNHFLRGRRDRSQLQFTKEASLIDRLHQAGAFIPMNFDGCANDLSADPVRFLEKWMHERSLNTATNEENKDSG